MATGLKLWLPEEQEEPQRFLRLQEEPQGEIAVYVVDAKGNCYVAARVGVFSFEDGFHPCDSLNPDLGFPVDDEGRIKIT